MTYLEDGIYLRDKVPPIMRVTSNAYHRETRKCIKQLILTSVRIQRQPTFKVVDYLRCKRSHYYLEELRDDIYALLQQYRLHRVHMVILCG